MYKGKGMEMHGLSKVPLRKCVGLVNAGKMIQDCVP